MGKQKLEITATVTGIRYTPTLCRQLPVFDWEHLGQAVSECASFILKTKVPGSVAVSWWVSPKRTRSYPYARVYDTLGFAGKKATIIPVVKDEGKDGDRDFLQWDTISLMSLLGVYVILAYYVQARRNTNYENKITDQTFDFSEIRERLEELSSYQSDALHWNLEQADRVGEMTKRAYEVYEGIARKLGVEMHSRKSAERRIEQLLKGKKEFVELSRMLAEKAQKRESVTTQPKERLSKRKAVLTIDNYLGGRYFFTADEAWIEKGRLYLAEGKHSKGSRLPSLEDIKDGLLKMALFTNLKNVKVRGRACAHSAVLKLTTGEGFNRRTLTRAQLEMVDGLVEEAQANGFRILLIGTFLI